MDQLSTYNPLPGIETYAPNMNPTLKSVNSTFELPFYQTKESLMDVDTYRAFLKNCVGKIKYRFGLYMNVVIYWKLQLWMGKPIYLR